MNGFLLSLMCLTGIHQKSQCPTQTPISEYQLREIWSPTNAIKYITSMSPSGYVPIYTSSKQKLDMAALRGRRLKIAAIEDPPYINRIYRHVYGDLEGTAHDVLQSLKQALGIEYDIVVPTDSRTIGLYDEKAGKWNGVLGMLESGEADFSINLISMLAEREKAVNFSRSFGLEKWVVFMQREDQTTDGEGLTVPFDFEVWMCVLAALLIMGPLCYVMVRIRCWACRNHPTLNQGYSFTHCVWFVCGAIVKQGSVLSPMADSTRILFAAWWLYATIITGFYTANLTAYLTLGQVPILYDGLAKIPYRKSWMTTAGDTMEQVLATKPYPGAIIGGNPFPEFDNLRWAIGNGRKYGKFMSSLPEMVERVRNRGEIMLEEQSRIERIIHSDFRNMSNEEKPLVKRCSFMMSVTPVLEIPYGFAFSKKTDVKPYLDEVLDIMTRFGLFDYWRRKGLPLTDPCRRGSKEFREQKLKVGDLMATYKLCGLGYSLGFASFLLESLIGWLVRCTGKMKDQTSSMRTGSSIVSFYKGNLIVPTELGSAYSKKEKAMKQMNGQDIFIAVRQATPQLILNAEDLQALQALQPGYKSTKTYLP